MQILFIIVTQVYLQGTRLTWLNLQEKWVHLQGMRMTLVKLINSRVRSFTGYAHAIRLGENSWPFAGYVYRVCQYVQIEKIFTKACVCPR
jgi:hypothetical protein